MTVAIVDCAVATAAVVDHECFHFNAHLPYAPGNPSVGHRDDEKPETVGDIFHHIGEKDQDGLIPKWR